MGNPDSSADLHDLPRLSVADAGLLALEARRRMPLHVGALLLFEGPPPDVAELRVRVRERLAGLPRYRARPQAVPLRQGRPIWAAEDEQALDAHVRVLALPGTGGAHELAALASALLEAPLDRRRA